MLEHRLRPLSAGFAVPVFAFFAELSFTPGSPEHDYAKVAILSASVIAALLASIVLASRNRRYRTAEGTTLGVDHL